MATLSLTLPISCQICLGKVKDPVICANNHAFCTVCLDVWLQGSSCCPTCRVDITKDKPYRKVLGSGESNDEMNLKNRSQLRKTRLELLGREYETELLNMGNEITILNQENKRLKEELDKRPLLNENNPATNTVEALSSLTKKLQEISSTYDDVRRDMSKLQEEKNHLQKRNGELSMEVSRLKDEATFTKSPKRYEKFTILGLKAKVDQYEKENEQLRKALSNRDKYMEQLQNELNRFRSVEKENCEQGSQANFSDDDDETADEPFSHSMVYKHGSEASHSTCTKGNELAKLTPLDFRASPSNSSCSPHPVFLNPSPGDSYTSTRPQEMLTPSSSTITELPQDKDMFPATKKLLELKKIHETRSQSSPPALAASPQPSPGPSAWPSSVPLRLVHFNDSTEVSAVPDDIPTVTFQNPISVGEMSQEPGANPIGSCAESVPVCTSLTTASVSADCMEAQQHHHTEAGGNSRDNTVSPKRNLNETPFMAKKIKIETSEG